MPVQTLEVSVYITTFPILEMIESAGICSEMRKHVLCEQYFYSKVLCKFVKTVDTKNVMNFFQLF